MHKITPIHLNGKAYQLEEPAYEALRAYLSRAESLLKDNPDKAEIIADLEQAFGDKCGKYLNPNKDVVTAEEMKTIIEQMGPVEGSEKEEPKKEDSTKAAEPGAPKRLYLILEGAWIAGVCTGLAAFFDLDVTLIRVAFIALTVLTGGAWILVYVALMFVVPYASTGEERAAAYGEPFNAQEIVNRAKETYERVTNRPQWQNWKQELHKQSQEWKYKGYRWNNERHGRPQSVHVQVPMPHVGASPVLGLLSALIAIVWIFALVSLITTGAIFGFAIPSAIPLWLAIIFLFVLFHAITGPLRTAAYTPYSGYNPWMAVVDMLGLVFIVIGIGFAYTHYPEFQTFVNSIPDKIQQGIDAVRN
jgi:phage shock protein PspC (stress-responsive transcriptional regulator)